MKKHKKYKFVIEFTTLIFGLLGVRINKFLLILFRNAPGYFGLLCRYAIVKRIVKSCGDNVYIGTSCYLFNIQNITIGDNVSIHPMCYIEGAGGLDIGNDVSVAHSTSILSTNHTYFDTNIPIKYNKIISKKIIIDSDVWIGCGCRILSGVRINQRAIIAAGAVVCKDVPSNSLVGGIPAKIIKQI